MTGGSGKRIRALIVDDEDLARQVIREMLVPHPDVEIVAECANGFEAVRMAAELKPDLIFLDIQMPKLDGFEVLELIGTDPGVVFVTAFDEHALRAFERPTGPRTRQRRLSKFAQTSSAPQPWNNSVLSHDRASVSFSLSGGRPAARSATGRRLELSRRLG